MLKLEDFIKLGNSDGFFASQVFSNRKNKLAKGFTYNSQKQKIKRGYTKKEKAYNSEYDHRTHLRMVVYGTADKLASGNRLMKERFDCSCCGSKSRGKFLLSDSGRRRLKSLRRLRAIRENRKD